MTLGPYARLPDFFDIAATLYGYLVEGNVNLLDVEIYPVPMGGW